MAKMTLFVANHATKGMSLWITDGTEAGTRLLSDIRELDTANPDAKNFVALGNRVVFSADNGVNGAELWISDGTTAGTFLLKDIVVGGNGAAPANLTAFHGKIVFSVTSESGGTELWSTDGSADGTEMIATINASGSANANNFRVIGDKIVFVADGGTGGGNELWVSDGTALGTRQLPDINVSGSSSPQGLIELDGKVIFSAASTGSNRELWITDGTDGGTLLLLEIRSGATGSSPANFVRVGDKIVFTANDGTNGAELWMTDGTTGGTALLGSTVAGPTSANPTTLTAFGDYVVFRASVSASGVEPWIANITTGTVTLLANIAPGNLQSVPANFTALGGKLVFSATQPGSTGVELWVTDGTTAGTMLLKDIFPGSTGSTPGNFVVIGDHILFRANGGNGHDMWITDGTPEGTMPIMVETGVTASSAISAAVALGDSLVFVATVNGETELWISDGSQDGTAKLADINPVGSASPADLQAFGDKIIFTATDGSNGRELWITDGTTDGTIMLADINPGTGGSNPFYFEQLGDKLLFAATGPSGTELYVTDGTPEGTTLLKDIYPAGNGSPFGMTTIGDKAVFTGNGPEGGELWVTDGSADGTLLLKDIVPGTGNSSPGAFVSVGSFVMFRANGQIWRTDGTVDGTVLVSTASNIFWEPVAFGNKVLFRGQGSNGQSELWISDGTTAGTVLLKDLSPTASSAPGSFLVFGDRVVFQASGNSIDQQLWITDGTAEGTAILSARDPAAMIEFNGRLYFLTAGEGVNGFTAELWFSDGSGGALLLKVINAGTASTYPGNFTVVDGKLYFTADDGIHGSELWITDGTMEGTVLAVDVNTDPAASGATPLFTFEVNQSPDIDNVMIVPVEGETSPEISVDTLFAASYDDPDDASETINAIAIAYNPQFGSEGQWEYSTDGVGWNQVGLVGEGSALVLNEDAKLRFVPNPEFFGTPTGLSVYALDATYAGQTSDGGSRITIDVTNRGGITGISAEAATIGTEVATPPPPPPPPNTPPSSQNDVIFLTSPTSEGQVNVLSNDNDPDGDALTASIYTFPTGGNVSLSPNGDVVYTPHPWFTGNDSFTYVVQDGKGGQTFGNVNVLVAPMPNPPANAGFTTGLVAAGGEVHVTAGADQGLRQESSAIAGFPNGSYLIAWQAPDGDGSGIFVQHYDTNGTPYQTPVRVNTTIADHQLQPAVTVLADGGYVIIWTGQDGAYEGIFGQRFDSNGNPVGGEFAVNTTTQHGEVQPQVTALDGGGFVVIWMSSEDGSYDGIFGQRFDSNGAPAGTEFRVNSTTAGSQFAPSIAAQDGGAFVAVWTSNDQDGEYEGIFSQRFNAAGEPQGEVRVNTITEGGQINPSVAGRAGGGYVVAYQSQPPGSDSYEIYFQQFDATGQPYGVETRANTTLGNDQENPVVTILTGGGFVIAWTSPGQDGDGRGIYAQQFDGSGLPVGNELHVSTSAAGDQLEPVIVTVGDGFIVSWSGSGQGDEAGIFTQRYMPGIAASETAETSLNGILDFFDLNDGGGTVRVTLSVDAGEINVDAGTSGATVDSGNGTNEVVVSGTMAQLNALFRAGGEGTVSYSFTGDAPPESATFSITIMDDQGATSTSTVPIYIAAENDAPSIANGIPDQTGTEDTVFSFQIPSDAFSDPDSTLSYTATLDNGDPLPDWLVLNPVTGLFSGTPPLDFNGTISVEVLAFDGLSYAADIFGIAIGAVSDAPTGTDATLTIDEDVAHVFSLADFGFDDVDGNALADITIVTMPAAGWLRLDGVDQVDGAVISAADIAAGRLSFVNDGDQYGDDYASITFRVRDDGGTDNGGADTAVSDNVLTFNVTPVDDNPWFYLEEFSNGFEATFTEDGEPVALSQSPFFADPDETEFDGLTLTIAFDDGGLPNEDLFLVDLMETDFGVQGNDLFYQGVLIGTYTGGNEGLELVITFNADASDEAVQGALEAIRYNYNGEVGDPLTRALTFTLSDGGEVTYYTTTATVMVEGVDDLATISVPTGIPVDEDTAIAISGLSIEDVDNDPSEVITVRFSVTHGTLTVRTDVQDGVDASAISADGTSQVEITASRAAINATLAANGLTYLPDVDYNGVDQLQVLLPYGGTPTNVDFTGYGGMFGGDVPSTALRTVTVNGSNIGVLAVGDAENGYTVNLALPGGGVNGLSWGAKPVGVAVGDFTGDGLEDLLVAGINESGSEIRFIASVTAETSQIATFTNAIEGLQVADLNGDGVLDAVTRDTVTSEILAVISGEGGTYTSSAVSGSNAASDDFFITDADGDGVLDIVAITVDGISFLGGLGDGSFKPPFTVAAGDYSALLVADVNGDGLNDYIYSIVGPLSSALSVSLGVEGGGFDSLGWNISVDQRINSIATGDVNGDGIVDIVTLSDGFGSNIGVFLGSGNGSFGDRIGFDSAPGTGLALVDMTGDGLLDIVTAGTGFISFDQNLSTPPIPNQATVDIVVSPIDDPAYATPDDATVLESGTVTIDVQQNDADIDDPMLMITAIDGQPVSLGGTVTLASGALVTLNEDGTISYDTNRKFDWLVSPTTAAATGATNGSAIDTFEYIVNGGSALVTVTVTGQDTVGDRLQGNDGDNGLTGTPAPDYFDLSQGGTDSVNGGAANDAFLMGASLDASDSIDGGTGTNDQVGLRGDYAGANALVLGSTTLRNIDTIGLLASPGDSYDITTHND
ncbi:ELWxxDGT repeat protein, partial [Sphingomonas sp. LT1P40]|uniref:ELWxxDGT repeat protein n=1 Tax=Alteristakelama amylovorans TaxID=3096166 RepID=UPI002FC5E78A